MSKEKKTILITSLIIFIIVLISLIIMVLGLRDNFKQKHNGTLYIVIKQYEVIDGHFKKGDEGIILFEAPFTDELVYEEKIKTKYGYNVVTIKNGKAYVKESNCPHPHALNGCMSNYITNDNNFLDTALIRCMPHGIQIGWEVRTNED